MVSLVRTRKTGGSQGPREREKGKRRGNGSVGLFRAEMARARPRQASYAVPPIVPGLQAHPSPVDRVVSFVFDELWASLEKLGPTPRSSEMHQQAVFVFEDRA